MQQVDHNVLRSRIQTEAVRTLFDYWESLRGPRRMPLRKELDPRALKPSLSNIWLVECKDPEAIRHRLVGDDIEVRWDTQFSGKLLQDVYPPEIYEQMQMLARFVHSKHCVMFGHTTSTNDSGHRHVERIGLPLGEDDENEIEHLIGCSVELQPDRGQWPDLKEIGARYDLENTVYYVPNEDI